MAVRVPGPCPGPDEEHGVGEKPGQGASGQEKTGASRSSLRDSVQEETGFAVLSCLKRFCGTKRLLRYILYGLKRLFGTKLCGHQQSGPENGVNSRPFCHRFFKSRKTVFA